MVKLNEANLKLHSLIEKNEEENKELVKKNEIPTVFN